MKCWSHKWGVLGVWLLIKHSTEFATLVQIQVGLLDLDLLTKWISATPLSQTARCRPPCLHTSSIHQCLLCYKYRPKNRLACTIILQINVIQSENVAAFGCGINYDHGIMMVNTECQQLHRCKSWEKTLGKETKSFLHNSVLLLQPSHWAGGLPIRKQCGSWGWNSKSTDSRASNISNKCLKHSFNTTAAARLWLLLASTPWSVRVQLDPVA